MSRSIRRLLLRLMAFMSLLSLASLVLLGIYSVESNITQQARIEEDVIPSLQAQLRAWVKEREDYRKQLEQLRAEVDRLSKEARVAHQGNSSCSNTAEDTDASEPVCRNSFIKKQVEFAEYQHGRRLHNEYEVVPYSYFTFNKLFPAESGLGRRVVEKPVGYKRQDLIEALTSAIAVLNSNSKNHNSNEAEPSSTRSEFIKGFYNAQDFVEGFYRIQPLLGTQYELWFKIKPNVTLTPTPQSQASAKLVKSVMNASDNVSLVPHLEQGLVQVKLLRPYIPLVGVRKEVFPRHNGLVNVIVPLAGRLAAFRTFLRHFEQEAVRKDGHVHLTVVYFGDVDGWRAVKKELQTLNQNTGFQQLRLLHINDTFSRGHGLQIGAKHWDGVPEDVLLFLCDVDVVFKAEFLGRCRRYAKPGKQAYFPMVFSLYNPEIVYELQNLSVPPEAEQLVVSKDTGFWRDFGFGMACTYKSDFMKVGGFSDSLKGWGGEDVLFYRKFLATRMQIMRSPDPGLFHLWHPKKCPMSLSGEQRRACLRSKALSEASHEQLGLLAFRQEYSTNSTRSTRKQSEKTELPESKHR